MRKIYISILYMLLLVLLILLVFISANSVCKVNNQQYKKNPDGWKVFLRDKEFSTVINKDGFIYAGGARGIFRIDQRTNKIKEIKNGNKSFLLVRCLCFIGSEELWIGHCNGITILKDVNYLNKVKNNYVNITRANGLPHNQVTDFLKKDNKIIYVSTFGGVAEFENDKVKKVLLKKDGLPENSIECMNKDSRGWIWMGSYTLLGGGIACFKGSKRLNYNIQNGLVHNNITKITETNDGKMVVAGGVFDSGGANILEYIDDEWVITETINIKSGLAGEKVRNVFVDGKNNIWFCSEYDGIAIFKDNGDILKITEHNGLSDNEVKDIIEDDFGRLWLATKRGLTCIDNGAF